MIEVSLSSFESNYDWLTEFLLRMSGWGGLISEQNQVKWTTDLVNGEIMIGTSTRRGCEWIFVDTTRT